MTKPKPETAENEVVATKWAIVFDLDGTLMDTPRGIVRTLGAALKSMGIDFEDTAAIRATIGLPLPKAFGNLLGAAQDSEQVLQGVKSYQALFKDIVLPHAKELIFPGVVEGLATARAQGFALAVATSKFYTNAEALLRAAGLWEYFDVVVGADQVTRPKPDPEMGNFVMRRLGTRAEHTVMVGDTTHDLLMAKSAGMRSIGVTYGVHDVEQLKSADPTWIVDAFDQVLICIRTVSPGHSDIR